MIAESDRGAIILAVTAIDDAIRIRLLEHFDSANRDDFDDLFDFRGPAGTFASRILLAKSLGIFGTGTQKRINLLRHLRNACAHAQNQLTFSSPAVCKVLEYFVSSSSVPVESMPAKQRRDLFVTLCIAIAGQIRLVELNETTIEALRPILEPVMQEAMRTWFGQPDDQPSGPSENADS